MKNKFFKINGKKPDFDLNKHVVQSAHYRARNGNSDPTIFAGTGLTFSLPMAHKKEYIS